MDRSKFIAIVTGAISIAIAIAYLLLVQFLDFRGPMLPAPTEVGGMLPLVTNARTSHSGFATQSPIFEFLILRKVGGVDFLPPELSKTNFELERSDLCA